MAGGNKKKKKVASNPARAVATTSIQSKSKVDTAREADSADASGNATPNSGPEAASIEVSESVKPAQDRELHELSPEELEAQLEKSDLQQFVENYAAKVRKDATRQVSRLQTEKRLLRGQADFLSVKDWLPEELMLQILDFSQSDLDRESEAAKKQRLVAGDDLVAKVWSLRLSLVSLDVPSERIDQAIASLLDNPPLDDSAVQTWGLPEALDWLALHCDETELLPYETERKKTITSVSSLDVAESSSGQQTDNDDSGSARSSVKTSLPTKVATSSDTDTGTDDLEDVSDLESDLEPDELLSIYLTTKTRLYALNPAATQDKGAKEKKGGQNRGANTAHLSKGERQLHQRVQRIEGDVLFDKREGDALWAAKKVELAREAAERRRLHLSNDLPAGSSPNKKATQSSLVTDDAEQVGRELLQEAEGLDDEDMLGGMFAALPGVAEAQSNGASTNGIESSGTITVRDFGKAAGVSPRRILDETCRSRDSRCKISYKQVSQTTYSCRHSVTIAWSKEQEPVDATFLPSIHVESRPRLLVATMTVVATPDVSQSESYVATAALFALTSSSPKEEKAHVRLPPAFRDLWDEFSTLKRDQSDAIDRETVKELRTLIEAKPEPDSEDENEVVFNATARFRSGASTPVPRPHTPRIGNQDASQGLKDLWARQVASHSYQRMLAARMNLPMFHARNEALDTIEKHQITIVVGDTGSGKSTQVPQFILENELSQGRPCKIYCTEPRRISAMSLAYRVSEELGEARRDFGTGRSMVGYAVRLDSKIGPSTKLIFATVGIVLRMLEGENGLQEITHLCLDEIHERSIDSDFLLIVLRSLLLKRPDLKVVLMSATVDAQKFSAYLDGAPIISVPGRTFPVEARFLEDAIELTGHTNEDATAPNTDPDDIDEEALQDKTGKADLSNHYSKRTLNTLANYDEYRIDHSLIVKLIEVIGHHQDYVRFSSAILVFLPGIAEIRQLGDMLGGHPKFLRGWRIHSLHSTFSSDEQQAAFEIPPDGIRKIVLATNIAETGITIPDVTCVIDTGKHREMRFDERRQMSRLIQSFIARANAKQRRGRAGRVQEGLCFHLFTRHRFESMMVDQQTPEMLRLSLQDLVMRVKICKLGDIEQTLAQALDPPSGKNIRRAIDALIEVDALTPGEQLTPLGHQLAKLPLDAQLGKLLLLGATFGCLDFALTVAAAAGGKSPFLSPMHAKKQADSVRLGYKRGDSDLLTLYNAYMTWRKVCTTPGLSEYTFCNKNFLSPPNLANIEDLKAQLLTALVDAGFVSLGLEERAALSKVRPGSRQRDFVSLPAAFSRADDNDTVCTSVVGWAFYPKIVKQEGRGWRNIANNQSLGLHPTSVNKGAAPGGPIKLLSFYSIMQSSSRFTNAQETSAVSDFALVLLAGDAVFHMYAGVIVVDGNRLRFKVRDWRTMVVLKLLRSRLREALGRVFKHPGRELGDRQRRWMEVVERVLEPRQRR